MSDPVRHHYIPVFYLTRWTGEDGRLCEFSRPYQVVKAKRKHPSGTGYVDGLYTIPGLPPEQAQFVEKRFMQLNDDWAAKALKVFLLHDPAKQDLKPKELVGWARFIYSLIIRTPEHLVRIKEKSAAYSITAPAQAMLPTLINSQRVIEEIAKMSFHTIQVSKTKHSFLTSDRPTIMTNGIAVDNAHIVIPISPSQLFVAVRHKSTWDFIRTIQLDELVWSVNNKVAEQARKYVYGTDDQQLRFVANRLGKMVQSTPLG